MSTASVFCWARLKNSAKTREPLYTVMIQNWAVLLSGSPTGGVVIWSSGASAWTARPRNTRGTSRTRWSSGVRTSGGHGRRAEAQRAISSSSRGRGHGISLESRVLTSLADTGHHHGVRGRRQTRYSALDVRRDLSRATDWLRGLGCVRIPPTPTTTPTPTPTTFPPTRASCRLIMDLLISLLDC